MTPALRRLLGQSRERVRERCVPQDIHSQAWKSKRPY